MTENWIVHLTTRQAWDLAQEIGEYRAASLETEGFIHCSRPDQVLEVANRFYRGLADPVLLWIGPLLVKAEIRWEAADGDFFPHIYGPVNLDAIKEVQDLYPDPDGVYRKKTSPTFIPIPDYREYPADEMKRRAAEFYEELQRRRSVRQFSDRPVPIEVIKDCLCAAATAPSGANLQPWHFVVVSDPAIKRRIRIEAEKEEHEFYHYKAPQEWLDALAPLGTDEHKPYLETAPSLIVIFTQSYGLTPEGHKLKHYYAQESVGIATGFLIAALHRAGLCTLTHTPSPMGFLNGILGRPPNERPFLILVVGYPAEDARVPKITKKSLDEITTFL
jgi:uncharacterized protein (DUF952 family)/nitroreductase